LPYNCCSIPFKSAPTLLLHLFLPPQETKLLTCASLVIFSYCPFGLKGSFTTSSLYLVTVHSYYQSGFRGSFILPLLYVMTSSLPLWMMDDFCSRSQQDSFPWTLWLYEELHSFVDDGWLLLTITTWFIPLDFIMIISPASFLCGWWMILAHHDEWISPVYKYHELPLWMMMNESLLTTIHDSPGYDCHKLLLWMMDESYSPTNHNWSPNELATTSMLCWMDGVCTEKLFSSIFLYQYTDTFYSCIHGPKWTSTH